MLKIDICDDANIHAPDIIFCKYCEDRFGANRGIYNTIDCWFFNQGVYNIIDRRKNILGFLKGLKRNKFGKGGLTIMLIQYFQTLSIKPIRDTDYQGVRQ